MSVLSLLVDLLDFTKCDRGNVFVVITAMVNFIKTCVYCCGDVMTFSYIKFTFMAFGRCKFFNALEGREVSGGVAFRQNVRV